MTQPSAAERWGARLLEHSAAALSTAGNPFVAFVVMNGELVAEAHNQVTQRDDCTAHAELLAVQAACAVKGRRGLAEATLYTSCEPCLMCLGAANAAALGEVYYGLSVPELAALLPAYRHMGAADVTAPVLPLRPLPTQGFAPLFADWARGIAQENATHG